MNNKQLDSYSLLITSKYFKTSEDFINKICVSKKFQETTEKLRFNPISIKSLKLFPKIQTQYLYNKNNTKIKGIDHYEIWYEVAYNYYIKNKQLNIKYHHITYTTENRKVYGNEISTEVTVLLTECYGDSSDSLFFSGIKNIKTVVILNNLTSIKNSCFSLCVDLENYLLSTQLTIISNYCFRNCISLTKFNIPTTIQTIKNSCYEHCYKLQTIDIPSSVYSIGYNCFSYCTSLQSIIIPTSISLLNGTFQNCLLLSKVLLPTSLISIDYYCFYNCKNLKTIELPTSLKRIENNCFKECGIEFIEIPTSVKSVGLDIFLSCTSITNFIFKLDKKNYELNVSYYDSILYKLFVLIVTMLY